MNEPDAFQAEMLLIHQYGRLDVGTGCLRNRTDGGEGISGYRHSEESKRKSRKSWENKSEEAKQKTREAFIKRMADPEMRRRNWDSQIGKKRSVESSEKKRLAMLGRKQSEEHKRKRMESRRTGAGWRAVLPEETKKKMSAASKGKPKSAAARANMKKAAMIRPLPPGFIEKGRLSNIGRKASPETREKLRLSRLGKKRGPYAPTRARLANLSALLPLVD